MIKIRSYQQQDAKSLWEIFFNTVRQVNVRDYSPAQVAAWAPAQLDLVKWQERMEDIHPYIAEIDGVIVGYADLQDDGLIDHFFCHYQYQGQQVGGTLMRHLLSMAQQKKLTRLHAQVSTTARPFFARFGFVVVEQQRVTVREQQLTNFIMALDCP